MQPKAAPAAAPSTSAAKAPEPTPAPAAVPATPVPAPATPVAAPAAPSPAAAAPTAVPAAQPAFGDMGSFLTGEALQSTIKNMEEMGFERTQIMRALKASYNNPDRAVEYLMNVSYGYLPLYLILMTPVSAQIGNPSPPRG